MPWFYAHAGSTDRKGPISSEQMLHLLRAGELRGEDVVWRAGMTQWVPAAQVPELAAHLHHPAAHAVPAGTPVARPATPIVEGVPVRPATPMPTAHAAVQPPVATPVAAPATGSLGYYAPRADVPYRAQQNLRKYAQSTGPTGEWPLNDDQVSQLAYAVKIRKRILAGHNAARLLFALSAIGTAVAVIAALATLVGNRRAGPYEYGMAFGGIGFSLLFTGLYWFGGQAIKYCRSWGSLVLGILAALLALLYVGLAVISVVSASNAVGTRQGDQMAAAIGFGVAILIVGAFAFVFFRAFANTGRYLATPLWCQEAIAVSEEAK